MSEQDIEKEIQKLELNAPRLTPEHIDSVIDESHFYVVPGTTTTLCCLILKNGFTVTGSSACASPENFNADLGEKIAFNNARGKIWDLEGYLLKERLFVSQALKA